MPGDPCFFHREQERSSSCIAACVSMVKAWSGPPPAPTEAELLASWSEPKTDVAHLADAGDLRFWDPTDLRDLERLRATLEDRWLIVTLFPGPLTYFTSRRSPLPVSKHGPLLRCENPRHVPGMPHAVVLVDASDAGGFRYLDPYYPVDGQPFSLTEEELIEAWTGMVAIPTLPVELVATVMKT